MSYGKDKEAISSDDSLGNHKALSFFSINAIYIYSYLKHCLETDGCIECAVR